MKDFARVYGSPRLTRKVLITLLNPAAQLPILRVCKAAKGKKHHMK